MSEERPTLEPVEVDARLVVAVGTSLWLVALVLLATVFRHDLQSHHATWWIWASAIGAGLGLYGVYFASAHVPRGNDENNPPE